jgi:hypothetical protein
MRSLLAATLLCVVACGGSAKPDAPPPTKRQVDSVIGASNLPGAAGVRGAMAVSDTMDARRKRADSIAKADSGR